MIDRNLFLSSDGITFDGKRAVPNEAVTKLMLELADLKPGEKVLEIGTGSGYQTEHLIAADAEVYSIDCEGKDFFPIVPDKERKGALRPVTNSRTVLVCVGDGKQGWPYAQDIPFDAILVSCGMTSIPPAYEEQLREGGRLVVPLGKPDGQELLRLEKRNGKLVMGRVGGYCRFQMCS